MKRHQLITTISTDEKTQSKQKEAVQTTSKDERRLCRHFDELQGNYSLCNLTTQPNDQFTSKHSTANQAEQCNSKKNKLKKYFTLT